jgi:hypothetical protein
MASTYLSRTPASAGNRKTFTFSGWFKRSALGASNRIFDVGTGLGDGDRFLIQFYSTGDTLAVMGGATNWRITSQVFRDVSAWYHIVVAVDTTQATASDRIKVYVNGSQITSFGTSNDPSLNFDLGTNSTSLHTIGSSTAPGVYYDGFMAHVHLTDGTAYDASAFGQTDATSGIWKPKISPSVTYGTNGFFLKFANSASLGTDSSGNANNFTLSGSGTQTLDTPSNVFATLNGISGYGTFSNGNLKYTTTTTDGEWSTSTLSISTGGKWYCEAKMISVTGGAQYHIGISNINSQNFTYRVLYRGDGAIYVGGSQTDTFSSYTTNDIIGMAYDASNRGISFYKNGNLEGTLTAPALPAGGDYFFGCPSISGGNTYVSEWNFGNGYFGTTAVATPESDSAGIGKFEYSVPSGYYALCTKNIATYG